MTNEKAVLKEFIQESSIKMISRSGKKTIFLFTNPQYQQLQTPAFNQINEGDNQQNIKIHKFVQKKLDLAQNKEKHLETSPFKAVSRENLDKRMKSSSPKNQGQFYKIHYDIIEKKTPFFAKLRKSKSSKNKDFNNKTSPLVTISFLNDNNTENPKNLPFEFAKKNHHIDFNKQLDRKELFEQNLKTKFAEVSYENSVPEKVFNINFSKYPSRKEIFPSALTTEKDYDQAALIYNQLNHDNSAFSCLFKYEKKNRKFFNEEKKANNDIIEPTDFQLAQGYCKTHRIYNTNIGCFSPKTGRERPSPLQNRILKNNEKLGFDCFQKENQKEERSPATVPKKIKVREKKFNLKAFKKEVELELKRQAKLKKKIEARNNKANINKF